MFSLCVSGRRVLRCGVQQLAADVPVRRGSQGTGHQSAALGELLFCFQARLVGYTAMQCCMGVEQQQKRWGFGAA